MPATSSHIKLFSSVKLNDFAAILTLSNYHVEAVVSEELQLKASQVRLEMSHNCKTCKTPFGVNAVPWANT